MQIIGQVSNINMISKWKTMPNFIIIQGEENVGKTYMTMNLCSMFKIGYMKMSNAVKDVRSLISIMKPNSNMLYHFQDFDKASVNAKNALLKITEEPIEGNYIVITRWTSNRNIKIKSKNYIDGAI